LLAPKGRPHAAREQSETLIQSRGDLIDTETVEPRRGQFNGQRDAVETSTYLRHRKCCASADGEGRHHQLGALGEESARFTCNQCLSQVLGRESDLGI
jgi:hypothetical protein